MSAEPETPAAGTKTYRLWHCDAPFRKNGTPVVGTMGSTIRRVVILDRATFLRMLDEHPTLMACTFEMADLDA